MIYTKEPDNRGDSTIFICRCLTPEHQVRLWSWDDMFSFEVSLNPRYGFFSRVWAALKYVFKVKTWYFEDVMLERDELVTFRDAIDRHLEKTEQEPTPKGMVV